ncbi:MAG TPA: hypothetical protein VM597_19270 [Gemmataceae bacterium]|jgi:hypothetical protein|nr:hypothetical protein [Gemmataceae bacterium]
MSHSAGPARREFVPTAVGLAALGAARADDEFPNLDSLAVGDLFWFRERRPEGSGE